MAREEKIKMPPVAFPTGKDSKIRSIREVIEEMENRQIALTKHSFVPAELLTLFVDPEYHVVLRQAWDIVEPAGTTQDLWVEVDKPLHTLGETIGTRNPSAYIRFRWHRHNVQKGFYVPYNQGSKKEKAIRPRSDAPDFLIARFLDMADALLDVHWRFSQCLYVFDALNQNRVCDTPAQMRYVWPCLYTLLARAGHEDDARAVEIASPRAGDRVRVPSHLMPLLKPTNDTIMRALLLDDVPAPLPPTVGFMVEHGYKRST